MLRVVQTDEGMREKSDIEVILPFAALHGLKLARLRTSRSEAVDLVAAVAVADASFFGCE
jgi:hypothetical protein